MGMIVLPDPFAVAHRELIVRFVNESGVTSIYPFRQYVPIGGLMSYGVDLNDQYRHAALYVDRILKGVDTRELPVQASTHGTALPFPRGSRNSDLSAASHQPKNC
jgi:putative ABC transport system substrate-binding protein